MLFSLLSTAPAIFEISQELQTTIGRAQATNLEYNFPPEGLTIKIEISVGELVLYGSFTIRSPSSLTADFKIRSTSEIDYFVSPKLYNESVITYGGENRQASGDTSVFITLVGQEDINTFSLNTTYDDTTTGCYTHNYVQNLKQPYQSITLLYIHEEIHLQHMILLSIHRWIKYCSSIISMDN